MDGNGDGDGDGDGYVDEDGDGDGDGDIWSSEGEVGAQICIKMALTSDFEVLEASGAPKGDQERSEKFPKASKKLPRSPREAPKRLLGGALGALGGPKSSPSHDPRYVHRFPSLQEPSRRSPSHDLSALSTFWSLQKGDEGVIRTREPGLGRARSDPRTRSLTRFFRSLYIGK